MPTINLRGRSVPYEEWGEGSRVVLLPSARATSDRDDYRRWSGTYLDYQHTVVRLHLIDPGEAISTEQLYRDRAQDAAAFIEQTATGPVHIYGYREGAGVGVVLAAQWPTLVRSLVLEDVGEALVTIGVTTLKTIGTPMLVIQAEEDFDPELVPEYVQPLAAYLPSHNRSAAPPTLLAAFPGISAGVLHDHLAYECLIWLVSAFLRRVEGRS